MKPEALFSMLSDPTRLRIMMLIVIKGELCVCELTSALSETQPKVSRHLALLRETGLLIARRQGTWMHYRQGPELAPWAASIIRATAESLGEQSPFAADRKKLEIMAERPGETRCG